MSRRIVREAHELTSALDAELWASHLLGVLWNQRYTLPLAEAASPDYSLILGEPLIEAVARLGGDGAQTALSVIGIVDDGELGIRAGELAQKLELGEASPSWLGDVARRRSSGAAVMREDAFDDASTVFLEARHPSGETRAIGVLIDNNLGHMAKDILLADSIDRVAEVMLRVDEVSNHVPAPERDELPYEERDRLRDEFLSSPEGKDFAPDGDEAYTASLAINFCADCVDGRPLRWSLVVVELFMANWIPRKVLADKGLFERLPSALDAWVWFAGRKAGSPEWAIEATREAIPRWCNQTVERGSDPAGAPAKQFLTAAKAFGVDVGDGDALRTFMAG